MKSTNQRRASAAYLMTLAAVSSLFSLLASSEAVALPGGATFEDLGCLLPDGTSRAFGLSPDGRYVVGWTNFDQSGAMQGFFWSSATGMVGVGDLPGGPFESNAMGVSNNGVVVGEGNVAGGGAAYRWTLGGGIVGIGTLGGSEKQAITEDISAAGTIVVGLSKNANNLQKAFRWSDSDGMTELGVGEFAPFGSSHAFAVSGDGNVIVGSGNFPSVLAARAWRWTAATGVQNLGAFDAAGSSIAFETSLNGSVVVGSSNARAFRWTEASGMVDLGQTFEGRRMMQAHAVSGDGSVIVGDTGFNGLAMIWSQSDGLRLLSDALADDFGLTMPGWTLRSANDISADGRTIVGYATAPSGLQRAFRIALPVPEPPAAVASALGLAWLCRRRASQDAEVVQTQA